MRLLDLIFNAWEREGKRGDANLMNSYGFMVLEPRIKTVVLHIIIANPKI